MYAEYIWIDGNSRLRSKTRVLPHGDLPDWDYDGSSTNQATSSNSEIVLKPCAVFKDPFRTNGSLVLCATYDQNGQPLASNFRDWAVKIFNKELEAEPWYGLEQEYFLMDSTTNLPLGSSENSRQGQYYCSVGSKNAFGRYITETHMDYCLKAGITISGMNSEVAPGQWEYQIGPCIGIVAADQLWVARYILERLTETAGVYICLSPKPFTQWNGSGCHTNVSTKKMRDENGMDEIHRAIEELSKKHDGHMCVYGIGNEKRLTGLHETSSMDKFTWGIANRNASIRINHKTVKDGCGYFEDRRPSANMNPYLVTAKIFETIQNIT
jgi:glutamine synthetase